MEHFLYAAENGYMGMTKLSGLPNEYGLETEDPAVKIRAHIGEDCTPIYQVTDIERLDRFMTPNGLKETGLVPQEPSGGGDFLTLLYSEETNKVTNINNEFQTNWTGALVPTAPRDGQFYGFSYEEITAAMNQALENQAQDETPAPNCEMLLGQNGSSPTNTAMKNG